jgi:formylglycine-generating enzyme required for sulfatase activity
MWAAIGADKTAQPNTTGYTKAFAGSSGSNSIGDYAWYGDNSDSKTHEVGKKSANELGLKDMSGNLWEWCWDWFEAAYPAGELTGFTGAASGSNRVRRGGSWDATAYSGTAAIRIGSLPTAQVGNVGFRFACP